MGCIIRPWETERQNGRSRCTQRSWISLRLIVRLSNSKFSCKPANCWQEFEWFLHYYWEKSVVSQGNLNISQSISSWSRKVSLSDKTNTELDGMHTAKPGLGSATLHKEHIRPFACEARKRHPKDGRGECTNVHNWREHEANYWWIYTRMYENSEEYDGPQDIKLSQSCRDSILCLSQR